MEADAYFKKTVSLRHDGHALRLRVAQDLFSSHEVDVGTRLLLRTLDEAGPRRFPKVLDLGCGYGPLGLALKKSEQSRVVHLTDRDALAVEYTRQNAALNGLSEVKAYGSLGYADLEDRDFDLVVSNLPGKAGAPVITHLIRGAEHYLRPGGMVAVVVVAALEPTVASALDETPNVEVTFRRSTASYAVFHYRFTSFGQPDETGSDPIVGGIYHRNATEAHYKGLDYSLETAYGLAEFDTHSFRTEMLLDALLDIKGHKVERAVVLNPGQGHVPVAVSRLFAPGRVELVDRDLLALRYSARNLVLNGYPHERISSLHRVSLAAAGQSDVDLIVGDLKESEGAAGIVLAVERALGILSPCGILVVAAGSTAITRLEQFVRSRELVAVVTRRRKKGASVLVLRGRR